MSIFYPTLMRDHISSITPRCLEGLGVNTLVLDVDNTLTTHNNPVPDSRALKWLDDMKQLGYRLVVLSNNSEGRVSAFAGKLGLDYTANAMKPLSKGFRQTAERLGVSKEEMAVVGDQIFTDILGGNLFGCKSILVVPMEPETSWGFRLKRKLEKGILKQYRKQEETK